MRILLPASPAPLQGPTIEDTVVARDEMANLAWHIELATQDEDGTTVDRQRRWLKLRAPNDPSYRPANHDQVDSYRLGTPLPDYWYPLMQTVGADGQPSQPRTLQRATPPPEARDVPDTGLQGIAIPHDNAPPVADHEARRPGTRLRRVDRLTYTPQGPRQWRARINEPGFGDTSSGLRFDTMATPSQHPNLVLNPDFARARRVPPSPLAVVGKPESSAAESFTLWNNNAGTTTTWVQPTTRPGGTGWMLHINTEGPSSGLVQQWAPSHTGPTNVIASAWVFVIRGRVMMGSGNNGFIDADAFSAGHLRWEHLTAANGYSPVNEIVIYAADPGGAEYLVDEVTIRPT